MALVCPLCAAKLSLLDVGKEFDCPSCGTKLQSEGWTKVRIVELITFLLLGELAIQSLSIPVALLFIIAWFVLDVFARKKYLSVQTMQEGE